MRDFLSKRVVSLEPSGIRKFFDIVSEMPDAISLGVGEPDFDTPWRSQGRRNLLIGAGQNLLYIECRVKGAAL